MAGLYGVIKGKHDKQTGKTEKGHKDHGDFPGVCSGVVMLPYALPGLCGPGVVELT